MDQFAHLKIATADSTSSTVHEQAILSHLTDQTAADQLWCLGYLDTGSHDVVFHDVPRVTLYSGWDYVLVEALMHDNLVQGREVTLGEDATPPGHH